MLKLNLILFKFRFIKHLCVLVSKGMYIAFTNQNWLACLSALLDITEHHPDLFSCHSYPTSITEWCSTKYHSRARKPSRTEHTQWPKVTVKYSELELLFSSVSFLLSY